MNMTPDEPNIPVRELTDALATVQEEDTPLNRASVLVALATSTVTVMLDKPWDGKSLPDMDTELLMVSDGDNKAQPMLAMFTDKATAQRFHDDMNLGNEFEHVVEVSGSWSLLGVHEGMGVMINPNQPSGFRIGPDLAAHLRRDVEEAMSKVSARYGGNEQFTPPSPEQ